MSAAELHLASVHLPVVLFPVAVLLLLLSRLTGSDQLFRIGCGFVLLGALFAFVAYLSGPYAFDQLELPPGPDVDLAEQHAVAGRIALIGAVTVGALALIALVNYLQGEVPPDVLRWALLLAALALCAVLVWTAHAGGQIRHTELRPPTVALPAPGEM